jgi:processive 1,2-diacylglycerol beta-glucosyltransferase/1,2-diacylglycerol 3-beta-galactosyltransferase
MSQKLMFLYLKTGGGHLSPARSVAQWIGKTHQENYKVDLVDGFDGVQPMVKLIVEDGYKKSQEKARWVFEGLYALNKIRPFARITTWIVSRFVVPALEKKIVSEKPDKIVIFHFFLIKPVNEILKRNQLSIPVLTVVTDPFTAHPIWFLEKDQNFIVFSEQLKKHLSTIKKIEPEKIHTFPFILNEKFSTRIAEEEKDALRIHHNIHPKAKVILIMGGADGIPKGEKILKRLLESDVNSNILMVCGWNSNLARKANFLKKQYQAENLQVFGYVSFVYELLSISDLVITKCGASTFMEVLMCGKIPLINSYIWEQEKGNVDFICRNYLGRYEKRVNRIPSLVETILFGSIETNFFKSNIDKMGLVNGTPQVSEFILQYQ